MSIKYFDSRVNLSGPPLPMQSPIATNVAAPVAAVADPNEYTIRVRNGEGSPYPLTTPRQLEVLHSELAFTRTKNPYDPRSTAGVPHTPSVRVFTAANGLNSTDDVTFMGIVTKGSTSEDDTNVTINKAGLATIYNTGKEPIRAHQLVFFGPPEVIQDRGTQRPLFSLADSESNKYYFSLRGLNDVGVYNLFRQIREANMNKKTDYGLASTYSLSGGTPRCPLFRLSRAFAHVGDTRYFNNGYTSGDWWLSQAEVDLLSNTGSKRRRLNTPDPLLLDELVVKLTCEYYEQIRRRYVGKALMDAGPGQQFDILLGFCGM